MHVRTSSAASCAPYECSTSSLHPQRNLSEAFWKPWCGGDCEQTRPLCRSREARISQSPVPSARFSVVVSFDGSDVWLSRSTSGSINGPPSFLDPQMQAYQMIYQQYLHVQAFLAVKLRLIKLERLRVWRSVCRQVGEHLHQNGPHSVQHRPIMMDYIIKLVDFIRTLPTSYDTTPRKPRPATTNYQSSPWKSSCGRGCMLTCSEPTTAQSQSSSACV